MTPALWLALVLVAAAVAAVAWWLGRAAAGPEETRRTRRGARSPPARTSPGYFCGAPRLSWLSAKRSSGTPVL